MTQKEALNIMKMGNNVYLTGEAGTGKTYTLNAFIKYLKHKGIPSAITASTGIAATHIDGVTIDSWSGLGIRDDLSGQEIADLKKKFHVNKRLNSARVLIIDEVSMIHGRRFDAVDKILRYVRDNAHPFGDMQVILCGDLFQLPPVSENRQYFDFIFKSDVWHSLNLKICYLNEPKRQSDPQFLQLLKDIRYNQVNQSTMNILQQIMHQNLSTPIPPTKLYTHNVDVDSINRQQLQKISGKSYYFSMSVVGNDSLTSMMKKTCLAPELLELKKGAEVMFVRNNYEKGYVNGTIGQVINFDHQGNPIVKTFSNKKIPVAPVNWSITDENNKILAQIIQIPLRLAWAITIHKSQGMTLDAAEIDLTKSFVEGMGYVALSRVKSLSGLKLLGINKLALQVNNEVSQFDRQLIENSHSAAEELNSLNFIQKWWKIQHR